MEFQGLLDELPLRQRLAMAYARRAGRLPMLAFLTLDVRLAGILRAAREPVLMQLRLAWWRDTLGRSSADWPEGEPLLAALQTWPGGSAALVALVDGWEAMIGERPLAADAMDRLADARACGFAALASGRDAANALRMGRCWAMADIAAHLGDTAEQETARNLARALDWRADRLQRDLRPLAVLHGMAARDMRHGEPRGSLAFRTVLVAIRLGLLGR